MNRAQQLKEALKNWGNGPKFQWDICVTWHVPNDMRDRDSGWDDRWLECEMRKYFNAVDRRIFKAAHKNRGERLARWITLERAGGVGWHSHALLKTPPQMSHQDLIDLLLRFWHKHCKMKNASCFQSYLFKAELVKADYLGYAIKGTCELNENANGVFNAHNTVLPKL